MFVDRVPHESIFGQPYDECPSSLGFDGAIVDDNTVERLRLTQINLPPGIVLLARVEAESTIDPTVDRTRSIHRWVSGGSTLQLSQPFGTLVGLDGVRLETRCHKQRNNTTGKQVHVQPAAMIHGVTFGCGRLEHSWQDEGLLRTVGDSPSSLPQMTLVTPMPSPRVA